MFNLIHEREKDFRVKNRLCYDIFSAGMLFFFQTPDLLFQVISKRYEKGSVILTSNRAFKDWGEIFGRDNTTASGVIERLCHHGEILKIEGESYRLRDKKKKNLGLE